MKQGLFAVSILAVIFYAFPVFSQDIGSLSFIHELGDKETATFGDAVTFFILAIDKKPEGFKQDITVLREMNLIDDTDYDEKSPLRRGLLALMIARHLNLSDSLLFRMIKIERYAFRACIADGIMDSNGSEWESINGEELIEIMSRVATGGEK